MAPKTYVSAALDAIGEERQTFMEYLACIGRTVGDAASAAQARAACPVEFRAWRAAFIRAYRYDPAA